MLKRYIQWFSSLFPAASQVLHKPTKEFIQIVLHRCASQQDPALAFEGKQRGHGLAALCCLEPTTQQRLVSAADQLKLVVHHLEVTATYAVYTCVVSYCNFAVA